MKKISLKLWDRFKPIEKYLQYFKNKDHTLRYGSFDLEY